MRPSPIREENQPATTPSTAPNTATRAISPASSKTSAVSLARMPLSTICFTRSGLTTTRHASTTVSARKTVIRRRWGRANDSTRLTVPRSSLLLAMLRSVRM